MLDVVDVHVRQWRITPIMVPFHEYVTLLIPQQTLKCHYTGHYADLCRSLFTCGVKNRVSEKGDR